MNFDDAMAIKLHRFPGIADIAVIDKMGSLENNIFEAGCKFRFSGRCGGIYRKAKCRYQAENQLEFLKFGTGKPRLLVAAHD